MVVFLVTAATGFVIGLFLRAAAIIAATVVVVVGSIIASPFQTTSWSAVSFEVLGLIVILQVAYLAGIATGTLARRLSNR